MRWRHKRLSAVVSAVIAVLIVNCSCSDKSELGRLKTAAKRGDPEAQFELGLYYHDGLEVVRDYEAAGVWFQRAAQQGHPGAELALGKMCLNAEGGLPDELQAVKWIRRAAAQGYAPAQDELARLYSDGIGVEKDPLEALNWASKAAEQGFPEAQYHVGWLLSSGTNGVPADLVRACVWFSLAAGAGDKESEEALENLKTRLSPSQLEEVKGRTDRWKRTHAKGE